MNNKSSEEKWVLMTELNGEALLHHFKFSSYGRVVKIAKGLGIEEEIIPKTSNGYPFISFTTREHSRITIYVQRLIAEFFVAPPTDGNADFVTHRDGNKLNNRAENLMWISSAEMAKRRVANRGKKPKIDAQKPVEKKLIQSGNTELSLLETSLKRKYLAEFMGVAQ
jgi:hypothetical protein